MRVLFVEPRIPYPSRFNAVGFHIGILSMIASLQRSLHEVSCDFISLQLEDLLGLNPSIEQKLDQVEPGIVCITAITASFPDALQIAATAKQRDITVILGGVYPTLNAEQILETSPAVDFVVLGEGETTIVELIAALSRGVVPRQVKGIALRSTHGIVRTQKRRLLNLKELPIPAYGAAPIELYQSFGVSGSVETTRGCPYSCLFCSLHDVWGSRYRKKPVSRVVDELVTLSRLGFREVTVWDSLFGLDRDHTLQLCRAVENQGLDLALQVQTRVDTLNENLLRAMYRAGVREIIIGVERIDTRSLLGMGKAADGVLWREYTKEVVCLAANMGYLVHPIFMLGWPGETPESLEELVRFAVEMGHLARVEPFVAFTTPHPGSRLWGCSSEMGLYLLTTDLTKYIHLYPVAVPLSLGPDAIRLLVEAHNTIRVESRMTHRNPCIDIEFVTSYVDRPWPIGN